MRHHLTVLVAFVSVALMGCRSTVDPAVREAALTSGRPLYMAVLDYQVKRQVQPRDKHVVRVELPKGESPADYGRALSMLYPNLTIVTDGGTVADATISIKGIRRTGALIGEVFGGVTKDGSEVIYRYYLATGMPKRGRPALWAVEHAEPWPEGAPLPLKK